MVCTRQCRRRPSRARPQSRKSLHLLVSAIIVNTSTSKTCSRCLGMCYILLRDKDCRNSHIMSLLLCKHHGSRNPLLARTKLPPSPSRQPRRQADHDEKLCLGCWSCRRGNEAAHETDPLCSCPYRRALPMETPEWIVMCAPTEISRQRLRLDRLLPAPPTTVIPTPTYTDSTRDSSLKQSRPLH